MSVPRLVLIAGPNGAGKSTLAQQIAPHWINPDTFPGASDVERARGVIAATRANVAANQSFALETTLSGRWTYGLAQFARSSGYDVDLHFVAVASTDLAAIRIAARVERGGHDVPRTDQERRFDRCFANAVAISPLCSLLMLYDNSGAALSKSEHRIVGRRPPGKRLWLAKDAPPWARLFLKKLK